MQQPVEGKDSLLMSDSRWKQKRKKMMMGKRTRKTIY